MRQKLEKQLKHLKTSHKYSYYSLIENSTDEFRHKLEKQVSQSLPSKKKKYHNY